MRDYLKEINATSHIKTEKPPPEPREPPLDISMYQLSPKYNVNKAIRDLRKFWERPFIIVGAKYGLNTMRNLLQRYETGNCSRKVKEHIFYHHQGAIDPIQDADFKRLCKVLINKPYQDFYLISIPKGAYEDDFMGWIEKQMAL